MKCNKLHYPAHDKLLKLIKEILEQTSPTTF